MAGTVRSVDNLWQISPVWSVGGIQWTNNLTLNVINNCLQSNEIEM